MLRVDLFPTHEYQGLKFIEIPFFKEFRLGNVFSMMVFDLDYENIEYGYRMDGPFCPEEGHRFDKSKILLDPYAKLIVGRDVWGKQPNWDSTTCHWRHPSTTSSSMRCMCVTSHAVLPLA